MRIFADKNAWAEALKGFSADSTKIQGALLPDIQLPKTTLQTFQNYKTCVAEYKAALSQYNTLLTADLDRMDSMVGEMFNLDSYMASSLSSAGTAAPTSAGTGSAATAPASCVAPAAPAGTAGGALDVDITEVYTAQDEHLSKGEPMAEGFEAMLGDCDKMGAPGILEGGLSRQMNIYFSEVHKTILETLNSGIGCISIGLSRSIAAFHGSVDTSDTTLIKQEHIESTKESVQTYETSAGSIYGEIDSELKAISDIVSIPSPDFSTLLTNTQSAKDYLDKVIRHMGEFDAANAGNADAVRDLTASLNTTMTKINAYSSGGTLNYKAGDFDNNSAALRDLAGKAGEAEQGFLDLLNAGGNFIDNATDPGTYLDFGSEAIRISGNIMKAMKNGVRIVKEVGANGTIYAKIIGDPAVLRTVGLNSWGNGTMIKIDPPSKAGETFMDLIKKSEDFSDAATLSNLTNTSRLSTMGSAFQNSLKQSADDFLHPFKDWSQASKIGKTGKVLGVVGNVISVGTNVYDYWANDGKISADEIDDIVIDSAVDIATGYGAMAAGAAVGSLIVPPLGTVVGAGVGLAINTAVNWKFGDPPKSAVDHVKDGIKDGINKIGSWLGF